MVESAAQNIDWKLQYETLMEQLGLGIESDETARKTPRFTFVPPSRILLVHVGSLVGFMRDISLGGVSFHIDTSLTQGRQIDLNIDQKFRGKVEVVNSSPIVSEDSNSQEMYRIGSKFLTEGDAYRCMVRSLKLSSQTPQI